MTRHADTEAARHDPRVAGTPGTGEAPFFFDRESLDTLASALRDPYAAAEPFPHVVLDDFFPAPVADRIIDQFPPLDTGQWNDSGTSNPLRQNKHMSLDEVNFGAFLRGVLHQLNGATFLRFVEAVTGIAHLLPDPDVGHTLRHYRRGGCLGVHTDFNWHRGLELHRRVNLIVYLNRGWREEYGGHLELWDDAMTRCVERVAPVANRAIIFETNEHTPHGFPDPLACPPDETRKTIQMYYYTSAAPGAEPIAPHRTVFRRRPGETISVPAAKPRTWRLWAQDLCPPLLYRLGMRAYRGLRK